MLQQFGKRFVVEWLWRRFLYPVLTTGWKWGEDEGFRFEVRDRFRFGLFVDRHVDFVLNDFVFFLDVFFFLFHFLFRLSNQFWFGLRLRGGGFDDDRRVGLLLPPDQHAVAAAGRRRRAT